MGSEVHKLEFFVRDALQKGSTRSDIEKALASAEWPADQIRSALGAYANVNFPVPVPKPHPSLSARDAFLYLVMFNALYFGCWNLGSLLFDLIDKALPDPADPKYRMWMWDSQRWATASIICAFPLFLFIAHYISGQIKNNPIKRLSPIRRWLTYLTLFIASCVLLGDVTTLVYNLLGGDFTMRFILKIMVVAAISGTIFVYYLCDLRKEEKS